MHNVIKKGDLRTQELLYAIDSLWSRRGVWVYTVRLNVHRRHIDRNRDGNDEADRASTRSMLAGKCGDITINVSNNVCRTPDILRRSRIVIGYPWDEAIQ